MYIDAMYEQVIIEEMLKKDKLLQFRLKLLTEKERKPLNEAYKCLFREITVDVFRWAKYNDLLQKKTD